jgi:hypothetical protein
MRIIGEVFFSPSNGLLNFRSNGLQVVALVSDFFSLSCPAHSIKCLSPNWNSAPIEIY